MPGVSGILDGALDRVEDGRPDALGERSHVRPTLLLGSAREQRAVAPGVLGFVERRRRAQCSTAGVSPGSRCATPGRARLPAR